MAIEYVIRIEDATSQRNTTPVAGGTAHEQSPVASNKSNSARQKAFVGDYIASKSLIPMAKSVTTHVAASVSIGTGSQELQQKTNAAMQAINTGISAASNITSSIALFGGMTGTMVGLVTTALGLVTQIGIKQAQINQQARLEGERLALYRSRLGAMCNGNRSGGVQ